MSDHPRLPDGGDHDAPSPWSPEGAVAWTRPPEPAVPEAPGMPPAPEPPSAWSAPATSVDPTVTDQVEADVGAAQELTSSSPTTTRRRSRALVGGAAVAVVALGLTGLFAVNRMSEGSAGGAPTADQLGVDLMDAVEAEDVLGIIDTLLPGERDSLGQPFVETITELQRLEVLAADTDLSSLVGLDIELSNESVQVVGTNVPDIVNVRLSADALVTLDGAELPIGALIEDNLPDDMLVELRNTRVADSEPFDLELTAVLDGDTWYFSAFHTIAELARRDAGGQPIPVVGVAPLGADTPEGAVNGMLDRVERLDLAGIIGMLDPAEAAALQRYAPLFLDRAQAELDRLPIDLRIDPRDFRVEGDGDERTVFVDGLGITGEAYGTEFSVRFEDGCVRAESDGGSYEQCADDPSADIDALFSDSPAIVAFVRDLEEAFADIEPIGLELRQRDGVWFVSPLATGTEALLKVLRALDRSEIDGLIESGQQAYGQFDDLLFGGLGPLWGPTYGDDVFLSDDGYDIERTFPDEVVVRESAEEPTDVITAETVPITVEPTLWERCSGESDAVVATACFEAGIASGELTEFDMPIALRHPECGLAEVSWSGDVYGLSDEEFVAVVGGAVECFQNLIASGELEEWEVPFEVTYFDCFENRNWFNVFGDDEYNDRVSACIDGWAVSGA